MRAPAAIAAVVYALLTLVLTYPLSVHPASTTFPPSSDLNLYAWTIAWDAHAFLHHPWSIFDANIFYPYQWTLAYSENLIGAALLVAPVQWWQQEPFLSMNLAALATVPLCALGAFVLARRLGLGLPAAWICGLVYGFAPPRFLRLDQAHLTAVEWIPFCLAYVHTYAKSGRPYDLRVAIAFLSLQAITSGHGAVFLLFAIGAWVAYRLVAGSRLAPLRAVRDGGVYAVLLLVPALLLVIPYRLVQVDVGLRRSLDDWTGSWASFLSSPTHVDAFVLNHIGALGTWVNGQTQAYLFPGYLPVLLAAAAFIRRSPGDIKARPGTRVWTRTALLLEGAVVAIAGLALYSAIRGVIRVDVGPLVISLRTAGRIWAITALLAVLRLALRRRAPFDITTRAMSVTRWWIARREDVRVFYLVLVVACALLAVGPPFGPWRYLYWLPGLSFIRVPSRFMILAMLGVAVLCAFGFERLTWRVSARTRIVAAVAICAALVCEFAVIPFDVVPNPVVTSAADRWLDAQPRPFVVAELPPMDPSIPMLHSTAHWEKTVHGYSGWNPPVTQEIAAQLSRFPDSESLDSLTKHGVTYLVVHTSMYQPAEWPAMEQRLQRVGPRLTLRYRDAEGRVYALAPLSAADN